MERHITSISRQGNEEPLSQQTKITGQQAETIETCTMDPCTMKKQSETDHHGKCPDCGKTDKPEIAGKND